MVRKYFLIAVLICSAAIAMAQSPRSDSLPVPVDSSLEIDTTVDYDELLSDLDLFLDSILAPRSYFLANLSFAKGFFNFANPNNNRVRTVQKLTLTPTIGYYAKSGLGLTLTGYLIRDSQKLNLYQFLVSPSYDYLTDQRIAAGIAFVRYFIKDSLSFYTSPLQNEINGYFLWRKPKLQPGIAINYGWGSNTEYKKRLKFLDRLGVFIPVVTTTKESVVDFSVTGSLRRNFYWLHVLNAKDHIRFTPQLAFSAGTQKFGFNQTTGTYGITRNNIRYNAGNVNLDEELKFQPLALTVYLRPEYSIGKFYLQPQFILDYYFPAETKKLSALVSLNLGFTF